MLKPPIRFAIVGCGRISGYHIEALLEHPKAKITAVCDIVEERAKEASKKALGAPYFNDYAKMLQTGGFDVVSICTPSGLHPQHGIMAAKAGYHVVSEKPIGLRLDEIDELLKICASLNKRIFVVKQNRLNPTIKLLKQAVEKKRFGKICFVEVNVFWSRPQEYYDQAPWRGTKALDGGAFMNQASHYVDLMHWLCGDVEEVEAFTGTLGRRIETEDTGAALIRFKSGALGTLNVTMLTYPKNFEGSITILGTHGTAKVGGIALNRIEHWNFSDYQDEDKLVMESSYYPPTVYGHGHKGYYDNVIRCLLGECEPETDGYAARASVEIILAMYKASETGRRVKLPLR
jgi:UDP-N-acetyl-2-amino-2-deoxyglucuronate dehydrogenase